MSRQLTLVVAVQHLTQSGGGYVAEASDLGLPPGMWPGGVLVRLRPNEDETLFEKHVPIIQDGEFMGYRYVAIDRTYLTVFND